MEGLKHIHEPGSVHYDVKLQNVLVFDGEVKIADFGLTKEKGEKHAKCESRGTSLFMSPESVNDNEYEPPTDIWALGCAVVEMVTGKPACDVSNGSSILKLLIRIGVGEELPRFQKNYRKRGRTFWRSALLRIPRTSGALICF
ncbi:hypothetical protein V8G54_007273 [Vigna mungo]|uniref:Protein kinase domain-containing protein n=1 Tax=Vigna mungo TaxID=3915 RepID=A0AAQ3S8T7_VIGMU